METLRQLTESFEAENTFSLKVQEEGWQNILNNFKKYVESGNELETLHFEIKIDAPISRVYDAMLDEKHYAEWTAVFSPGSHYKGSWEKGAKTLFLAPDENGKMGGMVSRIKENIPNKIVSIEHLGIVQDGEEITSGPEVASWAGSLENYSFQKQNGKTTVKVDLDSIKEYKDYFLETYPKALEKLKSICES